MITQALRDNAHGGFNFVNALDVAAVATLAAHSYWWPLFDTGAHFILLAVGLLVAILRGACLVFDLIHKYNRFKSDR